VDHAVGKYAMSDAKAKKIGEISETSFWVDDFAMAVQEIMSTLRVIGKSTNNPVKIYEIPTQTCKVCGMHHQFTKCFYAFPKKAPSAIKENPVRKRIMLAHDISLAKEKVTEPAESGKNASE